MAEPLGKLQSIRNKFRKEDVVLKNPCPKCGHELTIEKTEFFESQLCENCFDHAQVIHLDDCCLSKELQYVRLLTAAGTIQIRQQCKLCGRVTPNSLGGFTAEQKNTFPLVDESLRKHRETSYSDKVKDFYKTVSEKRNIQYEANKLKMQALYHEYLKSPEWQNKRALVLKRDAYLCQCCLNAYATQVHHKSYEFVDLRGNEPAFDLVAICVPCHERIEEMKRLNREQNKIQNG